MLVAGLPVTFIGTTVQSAGTQITMRLRLPTDSAKPTSVTLTAGLKDSADLKEKGLYVTVAGQGDSIRWTVFDPNSIDARTQTVSGYYRPHFAVERSLSWPESLRRIVESDMVTSTPLSERWLTLKLVLRENGYEVSLDGIPLAHPRKEGLDTKGYLRLALSPGTQVAAVQIEKAAPVDAALMHLPVSIESILNASRINGQEIDHGSFAKDGRIVVGGVPFSPAPPDAKGNDHVDVGASWFRQGGLDGRYSGSGKDAMSGRWVGALMKDPARLTVRLPMARWLLQQATSQEQLNSLHEPCDAYWFRHPAGPNPVPAEYWRQHVVPAVKNGAVAVFASYGSIPPEKYFDDPSLKVKAVGCGKLPLAGRVTDFIAPGEWSSKPNDLISRLKTRATPATGFMPEDASKWTVLATAPAEGGPSYPYILARPYGKGMIFVCGDAIPLTSADMLENFVLYHQRQSNSAPH